MSSAERDGGGAAPRRAAAPHAEPARRHLHRASPHQPHRHRHVPRRLLPHLRGGAGLEGSGECHQSSSGHSVNRGATGGKRGPTSVA